MSFECVECGYSSVKWLGKCPQCSGWDTFDDIQKYAQTSSETVDILNTDIEKLSEVQSSSADRIKCHITGIDRLLGGGVVKGEVILLGGPPGVGKSTLFLQIADKLAASGKKVLFVSGEESPSQIKIHSDRLGIKGDGITVIGSGDLSITEKIVRENKPDIIFVDSIQAVIDPACSGSAGSLKQVKRSGQKLTALAKNSGAVVFVSGQITKQGDIAGPKVLEHIVDVVIYLDALDGNQRIISAVKNRFGACGDFVLFNLTDSGLVETDNLQDAESSRRKEIIGQASSCVRVGSRLVVAELQSLVAGSYFEYPLRRTSGYSRERLLMLTAIGEKYLGLKLGGVDVYLNVSGPDRVNERTSDLGVIASIYSSFKDIALSGEMMFLGEVGLSGEVRPIQDISERIKFASRNKFKQVVLSGYEKKITPDGMSVSKIEYIRELREIIK